MTDQLFWGNARRPPPVMQIIVEKSQNFSCFDQTLKCYTASLCVLWITLNYHHSNVWWSASCWSSHPTCDWLQNVHQLKICWTFLYKLSSGSRYILLTNITVCLHLLVADVYEKQVQVNLSAVCRLYSAGSGHHQTGRCGSSHPNTNTLLPPHPYINAPVRCCVLKFLNTIM